MLDSLISSKTRIKLLLKFFLNSETHAHLRGLESEFGESSNAIRVELNRMEEAGLLNSKTMGNKKLFGANKRHPLFSDIHSIILKYTGLDQIIERVVNRLGDLEKVYLVGDLGKGIDSPIIDLVFIGDINKVYLLDLVSKAEVVVKKKIRYVQYLHDEFEKVKGEILNNAHLLLWSKI